MARSAVCGCEARSKAISLADQEIAAIEIAAISIASQKPLAMTPLKILAINANVAG